MFQYSNWESAFFGFDVFELNIDKVRQFQIEEFSENLKKKTLIRTTFRKNINKESQLSKLKFKTVDNSLEYIIKLKNTQFEVNCEMKESMKFEKLCSSHINSYKTFHKNLFKTTRYYFDEQFKNNRVDQMYLEWFIKSINAKFDDEVLGITKENEIIAFSTLKKINSKEASIGLFAVNPEFFFQGFGGILLKKVIKYSKVKGYENLLVKTQNRNIRAQKLYLTNNFKLKSKYTTMHFWKSLIK